MAAVQIAYSSNLLSAQYVYQAFSVYLYGITTGLANVVRPALLEDYTGVSNERNSSTAYRSQSDTLKHLYTVFVLVVLPRLIDAQSYRWISRPLFDDVKAKPKL